MPAISVITPTSKGLDNLSHLVRDFKNQLFSDFEHIIIYDGDVPDDLKQFIKKHEKDYNIKFSSIKKDYNNKKPWASTTNIRNYGVSIAKGDFVVFADDDDRYKDSYLLSLIENMKENTITVVQMSCQHSRIYTEGDPKKIILIPEIGLPAFPIPCHISTTCFMVPRKWALAKPWECRENHDFWFIKNICDTYHPKVCLIPGMKIDTDGLTLKGLKDWVSVPPFYRDYRSIQTEQKTYPFKYSFLLPYCKRDSFESTLISFLHHYENRKDYELVIIEDLANSEDQPHHNQLLDIIKKYKDKINIVHCLDDFRSYNSAKKYNVGFKKSSGQFIVLSNPEIFHQENILKGLDEEFYENPDSYVVCSCQAINFPESGIKKFEEFSNCRKGCDYHKILWYQHSNFCNRMLHFCSALSRNNFKKIGGFDEKYCNGIAYEDDSFLKRVAYNGISVKTRDDLITLHIEHCRKYLDDNRDLYKHNGLLFSQQIAKHDFFEKFV